MPRSSAASSPCTASRTSGVLTAQRGAIAHGELAGPVALFGSDAAAGEQSHRLEGIRLALLGTAEPAVLHGWFDKLAVGGSIVDPLAAKPWGASDGQVMDRHGLLWLIGYEPDR